MSMLSAVIVAVATTSGQPFLCPGIAAEVRAIEAAPNAAGRSRLVEAMVARSTPAPLIADGCATFVYRGPATRVALAGDLNGWAQDSELLTRVADTDLFVLSRELPVDARLDYKFLVDGKWTLDPLNPHTMTGGFGPNSELAMPAYRPPPEVERRAGVPHGTVEALKVTPKRFRPRRVQVYLPPGYATGSARYRVVYMHDGQDELDFAKIDVILDNLIADSVIPPVIAVLVPPVKREEEYSLNAAYDEFFAREMVPLIDARYRTLAAPEHRVVAGISLGGVAALSELFRYRDVFGAAIGQSSASDRPERLAPLAAASKPGARIWLDVGQFESQFGGGDLVAVNRAFRDAFKAVGHEVHYLEVPEGHSWGSWRARLRDALPFVLGAPKDTAH